MSITCGVIEKVMVNLDKGISLSFEKEWARTTTTDREGDPRYTAVWEKQLNKQKHRLWFQIVKANSGTLWKIYVFIAVKEHWLGWNRGYREDDEKVERVWKKIKILPAKCKNTHAIRQREKVDCMFWAVIFWKKGWPFWELTDQCQAWFSRLCLRLFPFLPAPALWGRDCYFPYVTSEETVAQRS